MRTSREDTKMVKKKLGTLIDSALHTSSGKPSASKIMAVTECALKLHKHHSKEVTSYLVERVKTCDPGRRLIAIYILDSVIVRAHKKLGRHSYPKLLEKHLCSIFELVAYSSSNDKKQIGKVLGKWRDRNIYNGDLVKKWAAASRCKLPKSVGLSISEKDSSSTKNKNSVKDLEPAQNEMKQIEAEKQIESTEASQKPPPVTISLNISKKNSSEAKKTEKDEVGAMDERATKYEPIPKPPGIGPLGDIRVPTSKGTWNIDSKISRNESENSSKSLKASVANSGGWGKFVSQPKGQDASQTTTIQSSSSSGWGRWGKGTSMQGVSKQSTYQSTSSSPSKSRWGGYAVKEHTSTQTSGYNNSHANPSTVTHQASTFRGTSKTTATSSNTTISDRQERQEKQALSGWGSIAKKK